MKIFVYALLAAPTAAFLKPAFHAFKYGSSSLEAVVAQEAVKVTSADKLLFAPDYYWDVRISRAEKTWGSNLKYKRTDYPGSSTGEELYASYMAALKLNGGYNISGDVEFTIYQDAQTDEKEFEIYWKQICDWSEKMYAKNDDFEAGSKVENYFDLVKYYYPYVDLSEFDEKLDPAKYGQFKNLKELYHGAATMKEKFTFPGFNPKIESIDISTMKKKLETLKEKAFKNLDVAYEKATKYAMNPIPDEKAKEHYKALKATLGALPKTPAEWETLNINQSKDLDEMVDFALQEDEEEHHHDEDKPSVAELFEKKYGYNLLDMQDRLSKFKNDPEKFLDDTISKIYGSSGLEIWKKSVAFTDGVMSASDKKAAEESFADFLKSV